MAEVILMRGGPCPLFPGCGCTAEQEYLKHHLGKTPCKRYHADYFCPVCTMSPCQCEEGSELLMVIEKANAR